MFAAEQERAGDVAGVGHLAYRHIAVTPEPNRAVPAAVMDAVGGQLSDR
jgi:hypothetical protein